MNKYILSLLLLAPICTKDAQAFIKGFWYPASATLLPKLDLYYQANKCLDCKEIHQQMYEFYLAMAKQQIDAATDLSEQQKETLYQQTEQFADQYTKYLAIYLSCAAQLLAQDKALVDYLSTVDMEGYVNEFCNQYFAGMPEIEALQSIGQIMSPELFAVWLLFMSDEHFQQEVEKYVESALAE